MEPKGYVFVKREFKATTIGPKKEVTIFRGFTHRYPQSFLDKFAEIMGIKWSKVKFKIIDSEKIRIKPLSPPSGKLYYFDVKCGKE